MIPGWLQAKRGSHVVITTIMFNFIASSLMVYVLVDVLKPAGSMAPQTRTFEEGGQLPRLDWLLAPSASTSAAPRSICPSCSRSVAAFCRLGGDLAHQAWLRDPHHGSQPEGAASYAGIKAKAASSSSP
jgi:ABC-type uncharacterized transport system permease subunit